MIEVRMYPRSRDRRELALVPAAHISRTGVRTIRRSRLGQFEMTDIPLGVAAAAATDARSAVRLKFIDNIRWSMIILVLTMHASDTYSPFGNWYYVDRRPAGLPTELFFGIY